MRLWVLCSMTIQPEKFYFSLFIFGVFICGVRYIRDTCNIFKLSHTYEFRIQKAFQTHSLQIPPVYCTGFIVWNNYDKGYRINVMAHINLQNNGLSNKDNSGQFEINYSGILLLLGTIYFSHFICKVFILVSDTGVRRRCVTHTDKYNHWFFFHWYNFIVAYVLWRCCDITSGKADTFSWFYNVNVLTQQIFSLGQTLKVGKSILLKSHLDYMVFIPEDEAWPLQTCFLFVLNHREKLRVLWVCL